MSTMEIEEGLGLVLNMQKDDAQLTLGCEELMRKPANDPLFRTYKPY